MKGKGLWIVSGIMFVFALLFLISGEADAFGGAVVLGAIFAYLAVRKARRQSPASQDPPMQAPVQTPAQAPQAPVQASAPTRQSPVVTLPSLDDSAGASFGPWDTSVHDADGQDVRFDRALFQNLAIQSYDPASSVAQILGSRGDIYETSLAHCTCEDFQHRGLPCKHIYKLALSQGYSADAFFAARSDVVWYFDGAYVYHTSPDCRGLRNRIPRRTTVAMAEFINLRPCKTCCED